MHLTPFYNGAINTHGMNSSPDGKLIAVAARGSSNIYLINTTTLKKRVLIMAYLWAENHMFLPLH
jgi:hypothetical protein